MKKFVSIFAALLFVMFCYELHAQVLPVQVTPQLVPPYSVYLSDYASGGNEKLRVILLQRDLSRPSYQIRLVMNVEWNGRVIMRTSRSFNPPPLTLDPGIPMVISGAELSPYLDSRNIDFVGYDRNQYEKTRALPEGQYRISFTAYDYRRQDVRVSPEGNTFLYLSKSEPPLINYPACGTKLAAKDPQQIIFSWMPRNTSSPNSVMETEYEFSLYETRPAGRNPNDVVLTSQPIFRTRTNLTQLIFGPAEPILLRDMTYVWRVQAIDLNGRDAFRNNGYSEVCTFYYGGTDANFDIGVVKDLQAIGESKNRGKISWTTGYYDSYRVEYKKSGAGYEWFKSDTNTGELKLFDLEPNTEYEARVIAKKSGYYGPYSALVKFRTLPDRVMQCGENPDLPDLSNPGNPLTSLITGTVVSARGSDMTILQVTQLDQPGWYKGFGQVTFDYFLGISYGVTFDRIFINENREVVLGRIDVMSEGMGELIRQQIEANKKPVVSNSSDPQWQDTEFHEKIFEYKEIEIKNVTVDKDGNIVIEDSHGNTIPVPDIKPILVDAPEKAVIIEDKNGDQWVVQKDQETGGTKVTKIEGGGLPPASAAPAGDGIKNRIIVSVLNDFDEEIATWLRINGKGGEDDEDVNRASELPSCFPNDAASLSYLKENAIPYFQHQDNTHLLVESIEKTQSYKTLLNGIAGVFSSADAVDLSKLSFEKQDELRDAVCESLVALGLDPISARIMERMRQIYMESGERVMAMLYCKDCSKARQPIQKQVKGAEILIMQNQSQICLGVLFKNSENAFTASPQNRIIDPGMKDIGILAVALPTLGGNNTETFGIYNMQNEYGSCTEYLDKEFFGKFDYCSTQAPTDAMYDKLLDAMEACVDAAGLKVAGDGIIDSNIEAAVTRVLEHQLGGELFKVVFTAADGKQKEMGEMKSPHMTINYKQNDKGEWESDIEFSEEYIKKLADGEFFKRKFQDRNLLMDLSDALEDIFNRAKVSFCDPGKISPNCVEEQLTTMQVLAFNLENVAKEGVIHPAMWQSSDTKRGLMPPRAKWIPAAGGVVDELTEEATAVPQLCLTIWEVYSDEEKKKAIKKIFTEEGVNQMALAMAESLGKTLSDEELLEYNASRAVVMIAFFYYAWVEGAAKSLDDALQTAAELTKKVENAPTLRRHLSEIAELKEAGVPKTKRLQELIDKVGVDKMEAIAKQVEPEKLELLLDELTNSKALRDVLMENPGYTVGWKHMYTALGRTSQFATDPATLKKISELAAETSAFRRKLGDNWSTSLDDILKTAKDLKCPTCTGGRVGRSSMEVFLGDAEHFVANFNIGSGGKGEVFYNWMRGKTKNNSVPLDNQLDELHQTLRDFSKRQLKDSDVSGMTQKFKVGTKEYDLLQVNGKFTEYKNKDFVKNALSSGDSDVDQFVNGYLKNITKMDDLTWKADFGKLNHAGWNTLADATTNMKKQWKAVFEAKSDAIFDANPALFNTLKLPDGTLVTSKKLFKEYVEDAKETDKIFDFVIVQ